MEDEEEQLSLKWSNFRSSLTEGFHDFLREEMMVDVTLAAEGKFVQAHKLILSVCSPYFKNLFKVNPCKHPIVILKDVGHEELSCMLQFMYKGEVGVKHEDLPSFLKLADTLKVKGLAGEDFKSVKETVARVRKKKNRLSDVDKENTESESVSDKAKEKKVIRGRKRRLSTKSDNTKKSKRGKSSDEQLNSAGDSGGEDEDDNPLVKLVSDKVKSGESVKVSESQCDDKSGFSDAGVGDDGDKDDDSLEHQDEFNMSPSFFNPENSSEADQAPQDIGHSIPTSHKSSPIWSYFEKRDGRSICLICCAVLSGVYTTNAEKHLRTKHPKPHEDFKLMKLKWINNRRFLD